MKGLLLKDFYFLFKQMKFFLLLVLIFAVLPQLSSSGFAILYAALLPVTALGYDQRSKWDQFQLMLPCPVRDIVLEKYLFGGLLILVTALISGCAKSIATALDPNVVTGAVFPQLFFICCIAVIFLCMNLPVMFKFGVEKGRLFFIALVVIGVLTVGFFTEDVIRFINQNTALLSFLPVLVAVLSVLVSIPLSIKLYNKNI